MTGKPGSWRMRLLAALVSWLTPKDRGAWGEAMLAELHGIEPERIVGGLSALGENNQLIFASSSPALAADFPGGRVTVGAGGGA